MSFNCCELSQNSRRRCLCSNRGLTLVELLIATTILSFAMAPIFAMFVFASRSSGSTNHRLQAQFIAHGIIEEIKSDIFNNPSNISRYLRRFQVSPVIHHTGRFVTFGGTSRISLFEKVGSLKGPISPEHESLYNQFSQFEIVVYLDGAGIPGVLEVRVEVKWKFQNREHSLTLTSSIETRPYFFERVLR